MGFEYMRMILWFKGFQQNLFHIFYVLYFIFYEVLKFMNGQVLIS
jgi:hypothetical protein